MILFAFLVSSLLCGATVVGHQSHQPSERVKHTIDARIITNGCRFDFAEQLETTFDQCLYCLHLKLFAVGSGNNMVSLLHAFYLGRRPLNMFVFTNAKKPSHQPKFDQSLVFLLIVSPSATEWVANSGCHRPIWKCLERGSEAQSFVSLAVKAGFIEIPACPLNYQWLKFPVVESWLLILPANGLELSHALGSDGLSCHNTAPHCCVLMVVGGRAVIHHFRVI